jgi:hypothetical protein
MGVVGAVILDLLCHYLICHFISKIVQTPVEKMVSAV